jgi:hypothetical protein
MGVEGCRHHWSTQWRRGIPRRISARAELSVEARTHMRSMVCQYCKCSHPRQAPRRCCPRRQLSNARGSTGRSHRMRRLHGHLPCSLEAIGDGPMRESWQGLADQMGLSSVVSFAGWQPQEACALRMQQADALVLPSLGWSGRVGSHGDGPTRHCNRVGGNPPIISMSPPEFWWSRARENR